LALIDNSTSGASLLESCTSLRRKLLTESSESAIRWACQLIAEHLPVDDSRHQARLTDLIAKARAFDLELNRDIDSLYDFLKDASSGECHGADTIVVETIHKSKGLEYDVVLFACEDKTSQSDSRIQPLRETDGSARWILEPVKKDLMAADPELSRLMDQSESQNGFGRLCNQYVGMTRAKRALYMISDLERVHKCTTVDFLRTQLGDTQTPKDLFPNSKKNFQYPLLWETGDPNWHLSFEPEPIATKIDAPIPHETISDFAPAHPRLHLATPSSDKASIFSAASFFDLNAQASQFGTYVHDAFEQIPWWDEAIDLNQIAREKEAVGRLLASCFAESEIRTLFTQPNARTVVWRERAFTYVTGDQYISGVFDRVTLQRSDAGAFMSAEIIDFKTDRIHENNSIETATEKHRPQLKSYQQALATITGLNPSAISLKLLFTDVPTLVTL
jgi:ATP-dependent exoDNAse (exonuclease V) beta subunit